VQVVWSESALQQLAAIHQYIAQTSVVYADGVVDRIGIAVVNLPPSPTRAVRCQSISDRTFGKSFKDPIE
jgi:hypothetical protein